MRYDQNGKDLVCTSCATNPEKIVAREMPRRKETEYVTIAPRPEKREDRKQEAKQEVGKQKYYCVSCSYIFLRNADVNVYVCPYCDKSGVKKYTAKSSDDLVKESEYIFD